MMMSTTSITEYGILASYVSLQKRLIFVGWMEHRLERELAWPDEHAKVDTSHHIQQQIHLQLII